MSAIDPKTPSIEPLPKSWLVGAPAAVIEVFADWREGRLTSPGLRVHINKAAEGDPAIKSWRDANLSALDQL